MSLKGSDQISRSPQYCHLCGQVRGLKRCAACRRAWYCSKEHQVAHWPAHKHVCRSNEPILPTAPKSEKMPIGPLTPTVSSLTSPLVGPLGPLAVDALADTVVAVDCVEEPTTPVEIGDPSQFVADADLQSLVNDLCSNQSEWIASLSLSQQQQQQQQQHQQQEQQPQLLERNQLEEQQQLQQPQQQHQQLSSQTQLLQQQQQQQQPRQYGLNGQQQPPLSLDLQPQQHQEKHEHVQRSPQHLQQIQQQQLQQQQQQVQPQHRRQHSHEQQQQQQQQVQSPELRQLQQSPLPHQQVQQKLQLHQQPSLLSSIISPPELVWIERMKTQVINDMNHFGVCVIDNFLGAERSNEIYGEVIRLYQQKNLFQRGQVVNAAASGGVLVRGDLTAWLDGGESYCSSIRFLIRSLDSIVARCGNQGPSAGEMGLYRITQRTKAMLACYPGGGTRYYKHVDNPNFDGRKITCIYYLNKGWNGRRDGGLLRIYPENHRNHVASVEPILDRLVMFWSDRRNPHEVLPSERVRFALTVWYLDDNELAMQKCLNDANTGAAAHTSRCQLLTPFSYAGAAVSPQRLDSGHLQ